SIDCLNSKDRCNLRINVSDTGKGISEEDINNIFNKFYRGEDNKDSDISGAGLGLSITKSLVELMDGKINVNSNEGEGTTFLVTLSQKIVEDNNQDTEIL
ncbi:MAG: ATP-binding protein, partial [Bacilli bacterium]|nr:ATP-binding protein [Bacilli bacterium]